MSNNTSVIKVDRLSKSYGSSLAVDNISFEVRRGEIFGLLGENGAGKTTTLEIIEGLRKPTSGKITVLGYDIESDLSFVKEKIGVQLQSSAYFNFLSLKEILLLFASFYQKRANPEELLESVGLSEKINAYVNSLSGGQKQRFSIIASLVNNPELVFLDEPTTGLDPIARRHLWEVISKLKISGKTIVLTTHYLEEAEILCDRIAIVSHGKLIAEDSTIKLIERARSPFKIQFVAKFPEHDRKKLSDLGQLSELIGKTDHFILNAHTQDQVNAAIHLIDRHSPTSLEVNKATLEDVFVELTGRAIEE